MANHFRVYGWRNSQYEDAKKVSSHSFTPSYLLPPYGVGELDLDVDVAMVEPLYNTA
jgi:hypothetical protein